MSISVADPVTSAMGRTQNVLFNPFDLSKWIALGFCVWLTVIMEGGGPQNFGAQLPLGGGFPQPARAPAPVPPAGAPDPNPAVGPQQNQGGVPPQQAQFDRVVNEAWDGVQTHITLVIGVAIGIVLLWLAFSLLFTWLHARGTFMFLDGLVHNRGAVGLPWKEYAREANSLFRFRFLFGLATFLIVCFVMGTGIAIAWPDIRAVQFGNRALIALCVAGPLSVLIVITAGIAHVFLLDFVVPIMYLRRQNVLTAWGEFGRSILSGHVGIMVLYLLFKIVLGLGVSMVVSFATCATCCIASLPFIGTVILLPLHVFMRSYSVYFLEQFGADWRIFPARNKPSGVILEELPPGVS